MTIMMRPNMRRWDPSLPIQVMSGPPRAAGNGLLNQLIAYWPGNEAAGNALDLHANALHLTDVNTVTSNPGLVYALARQYTTANLEYHTRLGDDALLSTGDVDFTLAAWCRADSLGAGIYPAIAAKWSVAAGQKEYCIYYPQASARFAFAVSSNGTLTTEENADVLGTPVINTWYLIIGQHDSVANTISIQVNNGAVDSQAYAAGVFNSTSPFTVGVLGGPSAQRCWPGRIGPTMFWKSAAGLGGVLTAAQRTALFNGGLGLPYASFTV